MEKWRKNMQFFFITAWISVLDNWIKEKREQNHEKKDYLNGWIRILTYHNYGAFLNSGDKKPVLVKMISLILSIGLTILFLLTFTRYGKRELQTGLAILLGGAWSNTYDRLKRGYVVDYLNFPKLPGKFRTVVYNISDFCILIGACLIIIKQK